MILQYGNLEPHEVIEGVNTPLPGPLVTTFSITPNVREDGSFQPNFIHGTDAVTALRHMASNPGPVKQLGGNELVQDAIDLWVHHSLKPPTWVAVVDPEPYDPALMEDFERFLSEYWGCPRGVPEDLEATHFTQYGNTVYAPGEAPPAAPLVSVVPEGETS